MKGILLLAVIHLFIIYQSQKKKADRLPSTPNAMESVAAAGIKLTTPLDLRPINFPMGQHASLVRVTPKFLQTY